MRAVTPLRLRTMGLGPTAAVAEKGNLGFAVLVCGERVPGAHYEIDDRSHSAGEVVETETALDEDDPTDLADE